MLWLSTTSGARLKEAKADLAALTPDALPVSIAARMTPKRTERGGPRDHHPPTMIEVDHSVVVLFRPEARRRDTSVVRLIRDLIDAIAAEPNLTTAILDDGDLPGA
jgi:hypothetical protein